MQLPVLPQGGGFSWLSSISGHENCQTDQIKVSLELLICDSALWAEAWGHCVRSRSGPWSGWARYSTISCKKAGAGPKPQLVTCVTMGTWPWVGLTDDLGSFECSSSELAWKGHKSVAVLKSLTCQSNDNPSMK